MSNKITSLSEEFRISTFLSGLRDELRIIVIMFRSSTLSAAFGLARLQEEEVGRRHHKPSRQANTNHTNNTITNYLPAPHRQTPLKLSAPNSNTNPFQKLPAPQNTQTYNQNFPKKYPLPIKRLTASQMQERRDKGL